MFLQNIKEITCNLSIWCKRNSRGSQIRNFCFAFNLLCQFLQISSVIHIPNSNRKSCLLYWSNGTVQKRRLKRPKKLESEKIKQQISIKGGVQTWVLSKNLHNQIFGPEILHTKTAQIATIFIHNETAQMH